MKHVEGLKLLLQPPAAPQDRLDEIKREQVPGELPQFGGRPMSTTDNCLDRIWRLDQIGGGSHCVG